MRSRLALVFFAAVSVVVLAACGAATPTATPTPTAGPDDSPDAIAQAYLALMDELAVELTRFGDPDGSGGSMEEVIDLAAKLEAYIPFFASLDQTGEQVLTTYGPRFEETAVRVAGLAVAAYEITGDDAIAAALERTPAFAVVLTDDGGPNGGVGGGGIRGLLSADDVGSAAGVPGLSVEERDMKAVAAAVDPAQVEHMDSFFMLLFGAGDNARNLILTTIDFDTEGAATDHLGLLMAPGSGMLDLDPVIGDAAAYQEVNQAGIGSMVVFKKGDWVVALHTAQSAGVDPLVGLDELERLARLVADGL